MSSAEQMTIKRLEQQGYFIDKCTYFRHKRFHDLFGVFDLIAMPINGDHIAIQATVGMNNKPARVQKIKASAAAKRWLLKGRIQVWTWRELKDKQTGEKVWTPDIEEIELWDGNSTK